MIQYTIFTSISKDIRYIYMAKTEKVCIPVLGSAVGQWCFDNSSAVHAGLVVGSAGFSLAFPIPKAVYELNHQKITHAIIRKSIKVDERAVMKVVPCCLPLPAT